MTQNDCPGSLYDECHGGRVWEHIALRSYESGGQGRLNGRGDTHMKTSGWEGDSGWSEVESVGTTFEERACYLGGAGKMSAWPEQWVVRGQWWVVWSAQKALVRRKGSGESLTGFRRGRDVRFAIWSDHWLQGRERIGEEWESEQVSKLQGSCRKSLWGTNHGGSRWWQWVNRFVFQVLCSWQ